MSEELIVAFPPRFATVADAALVRLQVLYPNLQLALQDGAIVAHGLTGGDEVRAQVRRQVLHTLYRERIYNETLPLRTALVRATTERW